jgi:hypothetical protein
MALLSRSSAVLAGENIENESPLAFWRRFGIRTACSKPRTEGEIIAWKTDVVLYYVLLVN